MKLRNSFVTAGLATAAVAGSVLFSVAPVHALTLTADDTLQLNGGFGGLTLNPSGPTVIDFSGLSGGTTDGSLQVAAGSTGGFASLVGNAGQIKDLTSSNIASGLSNFIRVFAPGNNDSTPGDDLYFDLSAVLNNGSISIPGSPLDVLYSSFRGSFVNATGATLGRGLATIQLPNGQTQGSSSWSMTIRAEAVPTPALLPGLAAFGMSLARKRKQEQAA
jgi:hypothetical protein